MNETEKRDRRDEKEEIPVPCDFLRPGAGRGVPLPGVLVLPPARTDRLGEKLLG